MAWPHTHTATSQPSPPSYLPAISQLTGCPVSSAQPGGHASEPWPGQRTVLVVSFTTVSTWLAGLTLAQPRPASLGRIRREVALGHTAEALGRKVRAGLGSPATGVGLGVRDVGFRAAVRAWVAFSRSQSRSTLWIGSRRTRVGCLEPQEAKLNIDSIMAVSMTSGSVGKRTRRTSCNTRQPTKEEAARGGGVNLIIFDILGTVDKIDKIRCHIWSKMGN